MLLHLTSDLDVLQYNNFLKCVAWFLWNSIFVQKFLTFHLPNTNYSPLLILFVHQRTSKLNIIDLYEFYNTMKM